MPSNVIKSTAFSDKNMLVINCAWDQSFSFCLDQMPAHELFDQRPGQEFSNNWFHGQCPLQPPYFRTWFSACYVWRKIYLCLHVAICKLRFSTLDRNSSSKIKSFNSKELHNMLINIRWEFLDKVWNSD